MRVRLRPWGSLVLSAALCSAVLVPTAAGAKTPKPTTERVSVNSREKQANNQTLAGAISGSGRYVVFGSAATNLVKTNVAPWRQIYLRDRKKGTTVLLSKSRKGKPGDRDSANPAISSNGRYVVFSTSASNIVSNKNFVAIVLRLDRKTGKLVKISVTPTGGIPNDSSSRSRPAISDNGRYVAFISDATNLTKDTDKDNYPDLFLRDVKKRKTVLVSRATDGSAAQALSDVEMSDNGRYVVYGSPGTNIVPGETAGVTAYLYDRVARKNISLSLHANFNNFPQHTGQAPTISGNARTACFTGSGGAGDLEYQIWCTKLKFTKGVPRTPTKYVKITHSGNGDSGDAALNRNGKYVAFASTATDLGPTDTNDARDVYFAPSAGGKITRVSVTRTGKQSSGQLTGGSGGNTLSVSDSSRYILFDSGSTNLVKKDTNDKTDLFVRTR